MPLALSWIGVYWSALQKNEWMQGIFDHSLDITNISVEYETIILQIKNKFHELNYVL